MTDDLRCPFCGEHGWAGLPAHYRESCPVKVAQMEAETAARGAERNYWLARAERERREGGVQ